LRQENSMSCGLAFGTKIEDAEARNLLFLQALSGSRYCITGIAGMSMRYTHYRPPQIPLDLFTIKYYTSITYI
jgi:hypothetical protein